MVFGDESAAASGLVPGLAEGRPERADEGGVDAVFVEPVYG